MSDDERDDDAPAEPAAPTRPKKKKKKRKAIAVARSAALAREPMAPPAPSWTTGHLGGALAVGLALGALGGYAMWGKGGAEPTTSKDNATASSSRAAMAPTGRPQPPQEPAAPVYIPLAAYSPREGPEHAKVTILEFSDFQ